MLLSLNQNGESALQHAAYYGSAKMVTVLVGANANLDLVNKVSDWGKEIIVLVQKTKKNNTPDRGRKKIQVFNVNNLILFLTHAAMHRYFVSSVLLYVSLMDLFPASLLSHPTLLVVVGTYPSPPSDTLSIVGISFLFLT